MDKKKNKFNFINMAVFLVTFIILIIIFELILPLTPLMVEGEKRFLFSGGHANCYPSNPGNYFQLNLRDNSEKTLEFKERFHFTEEEWNELFSNAPYCMWYDYDSRKKGPFPERKDQYMIVGDSFAFGEGLRDEDTISFQLSGNLANSNFRNRANSGNEIFGIRNEVEKEMNSSTDIIGVIYFYNLNDIHISGKSIVAPRQKFINDFQNIRYQNIRWHQGENLTLFQDLLYKTNIYHIIERINILRKETALSVRNYQDMYLHQSNEEEVNKTIEAINYMHKITQEKNISYQVVIYPLFYKDNNGDYPFTEVHKLIVDKCSELGITCVDSYPAFKRYHSMKRFQVHPIDLHPGRDANRIIADYLVDNGLLTAVKEIS